MFGFFNGYHAKLKWIFAIITFFLLFFDGALFANMAGILTRGQYHIMPMLLVIWFVYAVLFELDLDLPIYFWACLAGLIFDIFYLGLSVALPSDYQLWFGSVSNSAIIYQIQWYHCL